MNSIDKINIFLRAYKRVLLLVQFGLAGKTLLARVAQLEKEAITDELTQVRNRRGLDQGIIKLVDDNRGADKRLYVLYIDIDHFKRINDRFGHPAGDNHLRKVAKLLQDSFPDALIGRQGGEEFVVAFVAPKSAAYEEKAMAQAESLRTLIENKRDDEYTAASEGEKKSIGTASIGVCRVTIGDSSSSDIKTHALQGADSALYHAKRTGRNRVVAIVAAPTSIDPMASRFLDIAGNTVEAPAPPAEQTAADPWSHMTPEQRRAALRHTNLLDNRPKVNL